MDPEIKVICHRKLLNAFQSNAHHVSYLAKSEVDSTGVHHVGDSGWKRVSAIMDSGSAECVAPDTIARNIPLMETVASRQGQTYHTADGGVIKNKGEKTVTMYSEDGDQFRARCQITDVTPPLNSISRVCDQGNKVLFMKIGGWIINHETGRYTCSLMNMQCTCYTHGSTSLFPGKSAGVLRFRRTRGASGLCKSLLEDT